jgi:hypothetical protein
MATDELHSGAVLAGGTDGPRSPEASIAPQRPAAAASARGTAAGPWPAWARPQLARAVGVVDRADDGISTAGLLYREWFNPIAGALDLPVTQRPLVGLYRAAHAGSRTRVRSGGISVVARQDVIRAGGWWRTWGEDWLPPRDRPGSVRLMMTPHPGLLAEFVATVTARLLREPIAWSLACATDPRRIARSGCAVLDLPDLHAVPAGLLAELEPLLRPVAPPLCLPVGTGVGAAEYPDNGMTFGEHRCRLVALALRHPSSARDPLRAIAAVFTAHGIDPSAPYRGH